MGKKEINVLSHEKEEFTNALECAKLCEDYFSEELIGGKGEEIKNLIESLFFSKGNFREHEGEESFEGKMKEAEKLFDLLNGKKNRDINLLRKTICDREKSVNSLVTKFGKIRKVLNNKEKC